MNTFQLTSSKGKPYQVTLPKQKKGLKKAYIFAFAKSGSTLLDNMVSTYCLLMGIPSFSLFNAAFDQGIVTNDIAEDAAACIEQEGTIYTGFRHFPAFDLDMSGANTLLLTRDPRDMLVSMYFSIIKSHVIPTGNDKLLQGRVAAQGEDIDSFVIKRAQGYLGTLQRYRKMLENSDLTIYRYEDVIYEKKQWLIAVLKKLQLEINRAHVKEVVKRFDIIPKAENESEHIRQVHPGNYRNKLSHETIEQLNQKLAPFLTFFNYD